MHAKEGLDLSTVCVFRWDEELIDLAQTWTPKENSRSSSHRNIHVQCHVLPTCTLYFYIVIFVVDAKVNFNSYSNCMVASCDQKTIITTNPGTTYYEYTCINVHVYYKCTCTCMYTCVYKVVLLTRQIVKRLISCTSMPRVLEI